jgi:hypothetical protein
MLKTFSDQTIRVIRWSAWVASMPLIIWFIYVSRWKTPHSHGLSQLIGALVFSAITLLFSQEDRKRKQQRIIDSLQESHVR